MKEFDKEYLLKETRVKNWIVAVVKEEIDANLAESLHSGVVLCHLMLKLDSTLIPSINYGGTNAGYKYRENIEFFVQALEEYGIPQNYCFHPADLIKQKNMPKVIDSLIALAEKAKQNGYPISIAPVESTKIPDEESLSDAHKLLLRKVLFIFYH